MLPQILILYLMNKFFFKSCLHFSLIIFSCCLFAQQTSTRINTLSLKNLYEIDQGVYRSEQPNKDGFQELQSFGITEVLNLRFWHSDKDEAKGTDIILHRVKMNAHHIEDEDVIKALKIIKNRQGNILIHCKHGSDRTGVICAMYRIIFQNWSKEDALDELKNGGFGYHSIYKNIVRYIEKVDVEKIKLQIEF